MIDFRRAIRGHSGYAKRTPGLVAALLIAEFFYKFHSFTLECVAFLVTWSVLDWRIEITPGKPLVQPPSDPECVIGS